MYLIHLRQFFVKTYAEVFYLADALNWKGNLKEFRFLDK